MSVEGRGWVTRVGIDLVNWQQEEPADFDGRRQLSMGGTSRMSREAQVRICERLGVQLPGPTRRLWWRPTRSRISRPELIWTMGRTRSSRRVLGLGPDADQREAALRPQVLAVLFSTSFRFGDHIGTKDSAMPFKRIVALPVTPSALQCCRFLLRRRVAALHKRSSGRSEWSGSRVSSGTLPRNESHRRQLATLGPV